MLGSESRCRIGTAEPAVEGAQAAQVVDDGDGADILPKVGEVGGDVLAGGATGAAVALLAPSGEAFGAADVELRRPCGASLRD